MKPGLRHSFFSVHEQPASPVGQPSCAQRLVALLHWKPVEQLASGLQRQPGEPDVQRGARQTFETALHMKPELHGSEPVSVHAQPGAPAVQPSLRMQKPSAHADRPSA